MSRAPGTARAARRLGVLVPCRDEARVIERKLANLARCAWPAGGGHRVLVVDDGSADGTGARAREAAARHFAGRGDVAVRVERNAARPGKAGAIAHGVAVLAGADLVVLTDADVALVPDALARLAAAFDDPRVGMATGGQAFVRGLSADGRAAGEDGCAPLRADTLWDRATARLRALESRVGAVFSVHGQLLAWRASLGIVPAPGVAADDLDLMMAVRARGARVVRVAAARFLEARPAARDAAENQALRRARAYLQVVRRPEATLGRGVPGRVQLALYRSIPAAAPELAVASTALAVGAALALAPARPVASLVLLLALAAAARTRAAREAARLARVIRLARRLERRETVSDRWEMERA